MGLPYEMLIYLLQIFLKRVVPETHNFRHLTGVSNAVVEDHVLKLQILLKT